MSGVSLRQSLALEHVPEVRPTRSAHDLRALPVRIRNPLHGSGDLLIEARPAASGVELVVGTVERSVTPFTDVPALLPVVIVFSREGWFSAPMDDDPFFLPGQLIVARSRPTQMSGVLPLSYQPLRGKGSPHPNTRTSRSVEASRSRRD